MYSLKCNWKVFVDNYLDGGYHVPHLHKGLNSVLDYKQYTIENEDRYCLQSSPMVSSSEDAATAATRTGDRAWYFWQYPNFMINLYHGYMDTNLVLPDGVDGCTVIFDFYFADVSESAAERNQQSIAVGERVNDEDVGICEAVQRGIAFPRVWSWSSVGSPRGRRTSVSSAAGCGFEAGVIRAVELAFLPSFQALLISVIPRRNLVRRCVSCSTFVLYLHIDIEALHMNFHNCSPVPRPQRWPAATSATHSWNGSVRIKSASLAASRPVRSDGSSI